MHCVILILSCPPARVLASTTFLSAWDLKKMLADVSLGPLVGQQGPESGPDGGSSPRRLFPSSAADDPPVEAAGAFAGRAGARPPNGVHGVELNGFAKGNAPWKAASAAEVKVGRVPAAAHAIRCCPPLFLLRFACMPAPP